MIIDGTNGLTFPNSTIQASAGSVLQVVQGTYNQNGAGYTSTTSTSFQTSSLTASITPKFATSKILVSVNFAAYQTASVMFATIYRGATNLGPANGFIEYNSAAWNMASTQYLDSPTTVSSTTYTLYFRSGNSANTALLFGDNIINTITLMEIAA